MTESKKIGSWQDGCRALFAGFVASAPSRQVVPNITNFWETEQRNIILPTLHSLSSPQCPDVRRVLFNLLNSVDNSMTRMRRQETDDLDGWEDVSWELTKGGQRMFPSIVMDVQPVKSQEGSGRWWDQ